MKKEIVVKDYGKITIPERWEDVTLAQFTELMRRQNNSEETPITIMDVLEIFTGKEKDYLNQLPADFIESLIARLVFLHENPKADKASNTIVIDGEEYYVNYMEKLKFGEFTDVNQIIKDDHLNYAAILAILCRKKGEVYDDDFIADKFDKRMEMYNSQPITKILPLMAFFLNLWSLSNRLSQSFLSEAKTEVAQLLESTLTSLKGGAGRKLSLKSRMKAYWKLRKLSRCISQL